MNKRGSGVLLHITSLPSPYGVGTLGKAAFEFVDQLKAAQQTYWQILPLTTTSYGDSPYQSFSAVAGNTHLIDLDLLVETGLLKADELTPLAAHGDPEFVDYAWIFEMRRPLLEQAVSRLSDSSLAGAYQDFVVANQEWLLDYAEFMAIKEHFGNRALQEWGDPKAILRDPERLEELRAMLKDAIAYHQGVQFLFFHQWEALHSYAKEAGVSIIGDMPIYISADSVEVWTKPELFTLDDARRPVYIAGCPPDDFSEDGQLWGNPIYNWATHAAQGYSWWIFRIREAFKLYDYLRIDHFKGFSDFWQIPGGDTTARNGKWVSGPGVELFQAVKEALGELPIIAEDLGNIDDKTRKLLADCGFPGMKVMEFGFYDTKGESIDIPHHYTAHTVAYIGTHDNEVVNGWYENLTDEQKAYVDAYIHRTTDEPISRAMIRTLFATVSDRVIVTMQDLLDKPASSRMNTPNTVGNNWRWRMQEGEWTPEVAEFLSQLTSRYNRGNDK